MSSTFMDLFKTRPDIVGLHHSESMEYPWVSKDFSMVTHEKGDNLGCVLLTGTQFKHQDTTA